MTTNVMTSAQAYAFASSMVPPSANGDDGSNIILNESARTLTAAVVQYLGCKASVDNDDVVAFFKSSSAIVVDRLRSALSEADLPTYAKQVFTGVTSLSDDDLHTVIRAVQRAVCVKRTSPGSVSNCFRRLVGKTSLIAVAETSYPRSA